MFELVPPTFHAHISKAYEDMGQPTVNIDTFWNVYLAILRQLQQHKEISEFVTSYQQSVQDDPQNVSLLDGMEPFRLGQPLNLSRGNSQYIGGLESSANNGNIWAPADSVDFTTDDDSKSD